MKIVSSYKIKINKYRDAFTATVDIYRKAITFFIDVINAEWDNGFSGITEQNGCIIVAERTTHATKSHPKIKYNFDKEFYKFPSYLRRSAITAAYGIVQGYKSLHQNWVNAGIKGAEPRLQRHHELMPVMYLDNMFKGSCFEKTGYLKIYQNNDWVWLNVEFRKQDVKYFINNYSEVKKISAPTLERHHGVYYLRYTTTEYTDINKTELSKQKILAVDLGINHDAVCSVVNSKGTVLVRSFIDLPKEKDHLYHKLNKLKGFQCKNGSHNSQKQWNFVNYVNDEISRKTANEIVDTAIMNNVNIIVMEHLDIKGKKHGSKAQRLSLWKKRAIANIVEHGAHRHGIRFSTVNPRNTSNLAYDGSGKIQRDKNNQSLCTFKSGKKYCTDLSASYNIGARYFIGEILKSLPVKARSQVLAKVPVLTQRTNCTLSSLISLAKCDECSALFAPRPILYPKQEVPQVV